MMNPPPVCPSLLRRLPSAGVLALLVWSTLWPTAAHAQTTTLNFNSLPSAQGWTYFSDAGVAESSIFSVSGGVLRQNSINFPGRGHEYDLTNVVVPNVPFLLDLRARVIQESAVSGIDWGFGVLVDIGTQGFELGIGTTKLYTQGTGSGRVLASGLDNTVFHDYRIEGTLGVGGSFNVFVDNVLVGSDLPLSPFTGVNELALGDLTGDATAQAEVTRYVFTQAVPEPSAYFLISLTVAVTGGYYWQKRRKERAILPA